MLSQQEATQFQVAAELMSQAVRCVWSGRKCKLSRTTAENELKRERACRLRAAAATKKFNKDRQQVHCCCCLVLKTRVFHFFRNEKLPNWNWKALNHNPTATWRENRGEGITRLREAASSLET